MGIYTKVSRSSRLGAARLAGVANVASVANAGSSFSTAAALAVDAPASKANLPNFALPAGLCVLVVDDNPVNVIVTSELLRTFGIMARQAGDGAQAVAIAAGSQLDLILMDLQMPVLDGLDATRQIRVHEQRAARARVPVVAYTSAKPSGLRLQDYGVDDLLAKPCDLQSLRDCLQRWCLPATSDRSRAGRRH